MTDITNDVDMNTLIRNIYSSFTSYGAAFSSAKKIHSVLKKTYPDIGLSQIKDALKSVESYTLFKKSGKSLKQHKTISKAPFNIISTDLMHIDQFKLENKNIRYLLVVIDNMTNFLYVSPLINKTQALVYIRLKKIIVHIQQLGFLVRTMSSDRGFEYRGIGISKFLEKNFIYHQFSGTKNKSFQAERVIQTLKRQIYLYLHQNDTKKFIDILKSVVNNYNITPSNSLGGISPTQALELNPSKLFYNLYLKNVSKKNVNNVSTSSIFVKSENGTKETVKRKLVYPQRFQYKMKNYVRISNLKFNFQKAFDSTHSQQIYQIAGKLRINNSPYYRIIDLQGKSISGVFSESELVLVEYNEDHLFKIEKILGKKIINGDLYFKVRFAGYSSHFDKLVKSSDIVEPSNDLT
jgi:hypothetical protein